MNDSKIKTKQDSSKICTGVYDKDLKCNSSTRT